MQRAISGEYFRAEQANHHFKIPNIAHFSISVILPIKSYTVCAERESAFTGYGEQELSGGGGLEEQQVSAERNRLSKHTSIQLQQHRNPSLHRANRLTATAVHRDLHNTRLAVIRVVMISLHLGVCDTGTDLMLTCALT